MLKYCSCKTKFIGRAEDGFSLFEAIVVIAIIGIVSAIAIPNMISWRAEAKLNGAARTFKADMQLARLKAIREGQNICVELDDVNNSYVMFVDYDNDDALDAGEDIVANRLMDAGITIHDVTFSANRLEFNSRGRANKIGTVAFRNSANSEKRVILSNQIGRMRIEE